MWRECEHFVLRSGDGGGREWERRDLQIEGWKGKWRTSGAPCGDGGRASDARARQVCDMAWAQRCMGLASPLQSTFRLLGSASVCAVNYRRGVSWLRRFVPSSCFPLCPYCGEA
ncbi:hypothetical protein M758_4G055700 [Ceratodon purpureus]|nr:hypothetical protein M758_4G055700 [Ceratodon purpureus]